MIFAFIALAGFFTYFSSRRRNILLVLVASFLWFGLAMWLFFDAGSYFDLSDNYAKIFAWLFFVLSALPIMFFMNQEIRRDKGSRKWTEEGSPPVERESPYEQYAKDLHARMYRRRKKRRLL